jgi:hypothetical protein
VLGCVAGSAIGRSIDYASAAQDFILVGGTLVGAAVVVSTCYLAANTWKRRLPLQKAAVATTASRQFLATVVGSDWLDANERIGIAKSATALADAADEIRQGLARIRIDGFHAGGVPDGDDDEPGETWIDGVRTRLDIEPGFVQRHIEAMASTLTADHIGLVLDAVARNWPNVQDLDEAHFAALTNAEFERLCARFRDMRRGDERNPTLGHVRRQLYGLLWKSPSAQERLHELVKQLDRPDELIHPLAPSQTRTLSNAVPDSHTAVFVPSAAESVAESVAQGRSGVVATCESSSAGVVRVVPLKAGVVVRSRSLS